MIPATLSDGGWGAESDSSDAKLRSVARGAFFRRSQDASFGLSNCIGKTTKPCSTGVQHKVVFATFQRTAYPEGQVLPLFPNMSKVTLSPEMRSIRSTDPPIVADRIVCLPIEAVVYFDRPRHTLSTWCDQPRLRGRSTVFCIMIMTWRLFTCRRTPREIFDVDHT